MEGRGDEHAGREAVGHDLDPALPGELRDLPRDGEASAAGEVRLQEADVAVLDEAAERADGRVRLAGGDAGRDRVGEAPVALVVVRRERLLEPVETGVLDVPKELRRLLHGVGLTAIDHQLPIGAELVAGGADERRVGLEAAS